ncbi:C40 family peptidase [Psychrobacillus sp.]|uniref:C40 family peptidase n=1 Tax=Psychrobacillus sp. TaxID=1871623 RepID=UPI0028BD2353|nr:C40 family peptidase [Psychrobacillus sp.]
MNLKSMTHKIITIFGLSIILVTAPFVGNAEASSAVNSTELEATAKNLIGTKYRSGGTTIAGFDCSGYVNYVFDDAGVNLPRDSSSMYGTGTNVDKSDLISGDLVFFNTTGKGVSHVGIYIGGGKFIHSSTSKGVKIDNLNDPYYWGSRYIGAKRVANVTVASN